MAKEKQKKNSMFEAVEALDSICSKYSAIRRNQIEQFAPVYYPIAIVELRMREKTFEDFETVQLTVLKLVELGIQNPDILAQTLGLSVGYVQKVLHLLRGYGHISGSGVTALGQQSLQAEKKIVEKETMQKFQMDALNGTLLKMGQSVTENTLNDISETHWKIGHLDHIDGVPTKMLSDQLVGANCQQYLRQKTGILHTNVTAIREASCAGIQYAKAYLMKLTGLECPIVFANRYDYRQKEIRDRFSWQPFSVESRLVASRYGFEEDTPVSTSHAGSYIRRLYSLLTEQAKTVDLQEEAVNAVTRMYSFDESGLRTEVLQNGKAVKVEVSAEAVQQYRGSLLSFLMGATREGQHTVTGTYLCGAMVYLRIADPALARLGKLLTAKEEKIGKPELFQTLRERFRDHEDGSSLIADLTAAVEAL